MNIRFVQPYTRTTYLRREDVVEYVREFAAGEETDVRERLEEAACILSTVGDGIGENDAPRNPLAKATLLKRPSTGAKKCP